MVYIYVKLGNDPSRRTKVTHVSQSLEKFGHKAQLVVWPGGLKFTGSQLLGEYKS